MNRFRPHLLTLILTVIFLIGAVAPAPAQQILTPCQQSGFESYTSYEEMMQFMQDVQATSTEMLLSSFGTTIEGRQQPYAIFSRPLVTQPYEALVSGKPILELASNVHGGEKTVRDSLLILISELADPTHEMNQLLDKVIVLVLPSINPDGFVRSTRGNSTGVDMNREYINLEQPALRNYVRNILQPWQPHMCLDGHNGGSYPYNICYQGPGNAAGDQRLTHLCDREVFPFIDMEMQAAGFKSWYYSGGNRESWRGIPSFPRGSVNYHGLINCIGILFESPRQSIEDGVKSGLVASRALVKYTARNPQKIMTLVESARHNTIEIGQKAQGEITVRMRFGPKDYKVSYDITEGRGEEQQLLRITGANLMIEPIPTKTRPRPYAYILEPRAYKAVELLKLQNIMIEVLQEDTELDIEAYTATGLTRGNLNDHPAAITNINLEDETVKRTQTFPKGSYIIRTGQSRGRLASYMLEPETEDNVVTWNRMDAILPRIPTIEAPQRGAARGARGQRQIVETRQQQTQQRAAGARAAGRGTGRGTQRTARPAIIPIFKLMTPTKLPTKILK